MTEKFSLLFCPHGAIMKQVVGDKTIIGYLSNDSDFTDNCEREWAVYAARKSSPTSDLNKFREALGLGEDYQRNRSLIPNKWAVQLDVFVHGTTVYSISGEGPQCQFDTASGAAVWVPDESLSLHLESMNDGYGSTLTELHQICRNCLPEYNSLVNGEVYGVCVEVFDAKKERISDTSCWGFIGEESASSVLASEYLEPILNNYKEVLNGRTI